jgi:thiol-disulfide isomerase/thioredoxin
VGAERLLWDGMRPARAVAPIWLLACSTAACDKATSADQKMSTPSPAASDAAAGPRFVDVTAPVLLDAIRRSPYKAVLINAWASWCGPCKRELPMFQALSQRLSSQGVAVWLVSVDDAEDKPEALKVLQASGIREATLYASGSLDAFKRALNPGWPGMIPATFLFDSTGKLRYFWGGPVYEKELLPVVEGLLAGRTIDGQADFTLAPGKVSD